MKKQAPIQAPKPLAGELLHGIEHDGRLLPDLCAPSQMLDYTSGGFEFKNDAYYNPWPTKREGKGWKMIQPGLHVARSDVDVAILLRQKGCGVIVTEKAVRRLVDLGATITLVRSKTVTTTTTVVIHVTRTDRAYVINERLVENSTKTTSYQSGIWPS
jgi:hypothetical protein